MCHQVLQHVCYNPSCKDFVSIVHYQSGTVAPGVGEGKTREHVGIACPLITKHWSKPEPVCVCVWEGGEGRGGGGTCVHNSPTPGTNVLH